MHRTSSTLKPLFLFMAILLAFMPCIAGNPNSDRDFDVWRTFSSAQKMYAFWGFVGCYKLSVLRPSVNSYNVDDRTYKRTDELVNKSAKPMGQIMVDAMKEVQPATPNVHAEHGSRDDGMLWRGLMDGERLAYVQGVVWCVHVSKGNAIISRQPIQKIIKNVTDWYVIADDDWKDPRSNARVDVPVISALQNIGLLRIKNAVVK